MHEDNNAIYNASPLGESAAATGGHLDLSSSVFEEPQGWQSITKVRCATQNEGQMVAPAGHTGFCQRRREHQFI